MSNRLNQTNNSINESRKNKIAKLFLKENNQQNNDFKNEKPYYNCDEKKHITKKYFKFKEKTFQINVIKNFR